MVCLLPIILFDIFKFFLNNFELKDIGEASYVIRIEIVFNLSQGLLGLSYQGYINKVLKRFRKLFAKIVPIHKEIHLVKSNVPQCWVDIKVILIDHYKIERKFLVTYKEPNITYSHVECQLTLK
ncbi:hypothetical protein CR513_03539, partial [Mucuna pruriens]